jgi:hypothetical protein
LVPREVGGVFLALGGNSYTYAHIGNLFTKAETAT